MLGFSLSHLIVLLVVIVIFGPKRVSSFGAQIGKTMRDLRESMENTKKEIGIQEVTNPLREMREEFTKIKESANPLKSNTNPTTNEDGSTKA